MLMTGVMAIIFTHWFRLFQVGSLWNFWMLNVLFIYIIAVFTALSTQHVIITHTVCLGLV